MSVWQFLLVLVAGVWAGAINTVVGSGTLVTFPVLLAIGVPPVTANVTNTVGLVPGSVTGAYGYRRELAGQGKRAAALAAPAMLGALTGAVLLLRLPPDAFRAIVPVLIVFALALVIFGGRLTTWLRRRGRSASEQPSRALAATVFGTGVYGGYFGAAQGVLLMGFFGILLSESLQRQNALKNVLAGLVNLVASVVFLLTTHIDWTAAATIAVGAVIGGMVGARIGRRLSPAVLRGVIVVVGIAAIAKLLA